MKRNFAVFILTHERAENQDTLHTLERIGYSGEVYLIVDDADRQLDEYKDKFGDMVIVFSKENAINKFDTMTNRKEYRSVTYARNECFDIAEALGIDCFAMCDDDISNISYRVIKDGKLKGYNVADADRLFADIQDFMEKSGVSIFGFSQAGAYIGGAGSTKYQNGCQRNLSQMMFFKTKDRVISNGLFCQDLHMSLDAALAGKVALATMLVSVTSPERMQNAGGLHDVYADSGTWVRDFTSKISHAGTVSFTMGRDGMHMNINHSAFAPMILSDKYRVVEV